MPRALFIVTHYQGRSPGQRYRHEQYLDYLRSHGWTIDYANLLTPEMDRAITQPGAYWQKLRVLMASLRQRWYDVQRASAYDVVFVYREAIMIGTTFFERRIKAKGPKVIFDFDDAIWLPNVSPANRSLALLKRPEKTRELIALSDLVFAGNAYLAEYASHFNDQVAVIPSTIDTGLYQPKTAYPVKDRICIGWTGSSTTLPHFETALPALRELQARYGDRLYFKVIGQQTYDLADLDLHSVKWRADSEVQDLSELDIGIMPLPIDDWTKGKCGMKGLQYMALGIPTVMTPVGVNNDIIQHNVNGFLANDTQEWVEVLSQLIESRELRERVGRAGRQTVEQSYSVESQKDRYLDYFNSLVRASSQQELQTAIS
jgi:glycosyltransferase involved in cell wall biosynthesis